MELSFKEAQQLQCLEKNIITFILCNKQQNNNSNTTLPKLPKSIVSMITIPLYQDCLEYTEQYYKCKIAHPEDCEGDSDDVDYNIHYDQSSDELIDEANICYTNYQVYRGLKKKIVDYREDLEILIRKKNKMKRRLEQMEDIIDQCNCKKRLLSTRKYSCFNNATTTKNSK